MDKARSGSVRGAMGPIAIVMVWNDTVGIWQMTDGMVSDGNSSGMESQFDKA